MEKLASGVQMADSLGFGGRRCLWCLKPLTDGRRKYCSNKCRQAAYRWRQKGSPEPVYGEARSGYMSAEYAAQNLVELKASLARMAALKGRGDPFGDACASAARVLEDDLREMGL